MSRFWRKRKTQSRQISKQLSKNFLAYCSKRWD